MHALRSGRSVPRPSHGWLALLKASHPRVSHPRSQNRSVSNRRPKPPTPQAKLSGIWSRNELYRTSRPKHTEAVGKLVSVTNKRLTIQAQTYARAQAVTGTRAVLHDAQILTTVSFVTQARCSRGFRLDLQAQVRWTLPLVERPPPSVVKFNVGPLGKNKKCTAPQNL